MKRILTGGDHAGKYPSRGDSGGRIRGDSVRDLCLRRSRIVGRRAVDVVGAKLVVRHRLMIVITRPTRAGTGRSVFTAAVRVPAATKLKRE